MSEPSVIITTLRFAVPPTDGSKAYNTIDVEPKIGERDTNYTSEYYETQIEDVREKEDTVTPPDSNSSMHLQSTSLFADDKEIEEEHYQESIELIKKLTGKTRVAFFDHNKGHNYFILTA